MHVRRHERGVQPDDFRHNLVRLLRESDVVLDREEAQDRLHDLIPLFFISKVAWDAVECTKECTRCLKKRRWSTRMINSIDESVIRRILCEKRERDILFVYLVIDSSKTAQKLSDVYY